MARTGNSAGWSGNMNGAIALLTAILCCWVQLCDTTTAGYQYDPNNIRDASNATIAHSDPDVFILDDFLTESECDTIIRLAKPTLQRSTGGLSRTVSQSRTSSNTWLNTEVVKDVEGREILQVIEDKIADLLQLPVENQEHFQVLEYTIGQYYKEHHDYIPEHVGFPCGPRVATFFLYLSDVEAGGATNFPNIGVNVTPKKGRAALWFNVKQGTDEMDLRTLHQALPVTKGIKWAANKWIHSHDFVNNWKRGLTG